MLTQDEQFRMEAEEGRKKYESFRAEAEEMRAKYQSEHSGELRAGSAQRSISPGAELFVLCQHYSKPRAMRSASSFDLPD